MSCLLYRYILYAVCVLCICTDYNCVQWGVYIILNEDERDLLELKKLKLILAKNDCPDKIINTEINKFIQNRERIEPVLATAQDETNSDVSEPITEDKKVSQTTTKSKEKIRHI